MISRSRSTRSTALALLAATVLGNVERDAAAAPRTSSLAWVRMPGAEACIDARTLAQAVERRLGRAAFVPPTRGDVVIEARIEHMQSPEAFRATVTLFDAANARLGVRELQTAGAECRAIDDELELVIALLIDPDATISPATPAPAPAPPLEPAPPAPHRDTLSPAPPAPAVPPLRLPPPLEPIPPFRLGVAASAVVGLGLVPGPADIGIALHMHLTPRRGPSFELGGAVWASPVVNIVRGAPAFSLAYGSLSVCPLHAARGKSALAACLGVMLGSLRVDSVDLPSEYRRERLVLDLDLSARLRHRLVGPLFGSVGLGVAVPTLRDIFYLTDAAGMRHDVFQASLVAGILDAGLGLELP